MVGAVFSTINNCEKLDHSKNFEPTDKNICDIEFKSPFDFVSLDKFMERVRFFSMRTVLHNLMHDELK